jgi:hypothetical protein
MPRGAIAEPEPVLAGSVSFSIEPVALSLITKDGYQRDRVDSHVDRIVSQFDPAQWDLPKVALKEDGTYRVIAGQHRVEAARRLQNDQSWPFSTEPGIIDAQVITGIPDTRGEAALFMADAKNKKNLSAFDKHRASIIAGDERAIEVQAAVDEGPKQRRRDPTRSAGDRWLSLTASP